MSVHSPDKSNTQWMADTGPAPVRLLLAGVEGDASALVGEKVAGFPLDLVLVDADANVDPSTLSGAVAAVVQVTEGNDRSIARFKKLAASDVPLIAAAYEPSLAFVRSLVRAGAHDVVPLPLEPGKDVGAPVHRAPKTSPPSAIFSEPRLLRPLLHGSRSPETLSTKCSNGAANQVSASSTGPRYSYPSACAR